jgi:nucleotide-binding universal stress UspA family protein
MTGHPARPILVATDFSDSAEAARGVAVRHARELHARLHLLHVFWGREVEVTQLLAHAAAQAGPDVPVTVGPALTPQRETRVQLQAECERRYCVC